MYIVILCAWMCWLIHKCVFQSGVVRKKIDFEMKNTSTSIHLSEIFAFSFVEDKCVEADTTRIVIWPFGRNFIPCSLPWARDFDKLANEQMKPNDFLE